MKRQRGRGRKPGGGGGGGGGGGSHGNHGNRSLESNGPDVKIRGTAAQIYEKYAQYARDAQSGGDRVKYENYLQHAEHYYRVMAATMPRERLLAMPEGGMGAEGQDGQNNQGQGGYNQQPQGGMGGGMNSPQNQGGDSSDPLKVMDDQSGSDDDGDYDNDGEEGGDEPREEVRAVSPGSAGGNDEQGADRQGRRRRRGRRGRNQDGPNDGGGNNGGGNNTGGGSGGGSALDSLARKQGALAGG